MQVVHPQKRRVLRQILDGTMGRLLEVKNEMVDLEFSEFHYFDDVLSDLKLTPVSGLCLYAFNQVEYLTKKKFPEPFNVQL